MITAQLSVSSELVQALQLVTYKHVAMIMAIAQRLGVTKIGIVGNEQFL